MLHVDSLHKHLLKCSKSGAQSDSAFAQNRLPLLAHIDALLSSRDRIAVKSSDGNSDGTFRVESKITLLKERHASAESRIVKIFSWLFKKQFKSHVKAWLDGV
jgi:hypothetical protein